MTKTFQVLSTVTSLILLPATFGVANAANMSMKSCGGEGRINKQIHGCSNFGHHRGHRKTKHSHNMKYKL